MNHLIISREYPPCPYPAGGIGTYVTQIAHLLASHGERVHVVAQRWPGASRTVEHLVDGALTVHRVSLDEPLPHVSSTRTVRVASILESLGRSAFPAMAFAWQAASLAEHLAASEGIDLIEGQDYEAPLYFLALRRGQRLETASRIPMFLHLHTPTELAFGGNGWAVDRPDCATAMRVEASAIRSVDALLSPSRFLARIAESHYGLTRGAVSVIPYPLRATAPATRHSATWESGTICYVGRLEPRKGVAEWVEAAVSTARRRRDVRFTLIGGDSFPDGRQGSMRAELVARIPPGIADRVVFVDHVPRHRLNEHLARARMAVVPSRWENFPYACLEAMASGLPVIVSPNGGMSEIVEDGRTGWIAASCSPADLEAALERALGTPPDLLAKMGAAAAESVRATCTGPGILRRHLEFRRQVAARSTHDAPLVRGSADPDALEQMALQVAASTMQLPAHPVQGERVMTLGEILRASPARQGQVLRRAIRNPVYVTQWLRWHLRRLMDRLTHRRQRGTRLRER